MVTPRARNGRRALRARRPERGQRGMTLLEVMVSVFILTMISLMIYTAFSHTALLRTRLVGRQEQDHLARTALNRVARDVRSAFLSAHINTNPTYMAVVTAFVGVDQSGGDRLDMTTFTHRRLVRNSHEGDACEVGYRVEDRRGGEPGHDLLRRETARIDNEPRRGGVVDVLMPNIEDFQIRYFDNNTETWGDTWDTMQGLGQQGRLPARVRITISVRDANHQVLRYMTETAPVLTSVLRFGLPLDYH